MTTPRFARQPLKGIFLAYQLFIVLLWYLPSWILLSVIPAWRPRPSWTFRQSMLIRVIRYASMLNRQTGPLSRSPTHLAIEPGVGVNGIWVEPSPELINGDVAVWAEQAQVFPIRLPGYWIHKKNSAIPVAAPPMPGEKVVYALHGGAYILLSAHPGDSTAAIARGILKNCTVVQRVFQIEYRLSASSESGPNPFPTALIDALMGYNYLVNTVGFSPNDIIVEGDSAGGNLCHALTRYLVESQANSKIPAPPSGIILLSPWVDLGMSHETDGSSMFTRMKTDYIMKHDLQARNAEIKRAPWVNPAFLGPLGPEGAQTNRYMSPASLDASVDFSGFPRTFIVGGEAEVLIDQIRTFKARMIDALGEENRVDQDGQKGTGKVTYHEEMDAPHDYLIFPAFKPSPTFLAISRWIEAAV